MKASRCDRKRNLFRSVFIPAQDRIGAVPVHPRVAPYEHRTSRVQALSVVISPARTPHSPSGTTTQGDQLEFARLSADRAVFQQVLGALHE
jgi:hypothetical protein